MLELQPELDERLRVTVDAVRQAADVEDAEPSLERCPACDGRGVVRPDNELYCERCDGAGTIPGVAARAP